MSLRAIVAERLANALPDGMTRTELARVLGVTPPYVTMVLQGRDNLTVEQVERFAHAMGCEVSTYLVRIPVKKPGKVRAAAGTKEESEATFTRTLRRLCNTLPPRSHPGRGPKPRSGAAVAYACAVRVWLHTSARQLESGIHYNTILSAMNTPLFADDLRLIVGNAQRQAAGLKVNAADYGKHMHDSATGVGNEILLRQLCDLAMAITWPEAK